MSQFSPGFLIKHIAKSFELVKLDIENTHNMHMYLYQNYLHANSVLDNTGNYKRKNTTYSIYIWMRQYTRKMCIFFMTKEQSSVLSNSSFMYSHSYIFLFVTVFGNDSI